MYFKVVLEGGHVGAGKSFEMVRYFEAENAIVLLKYLEKHPALKSKGTGKGIALVEPISKEEYLVKKNIEKNDPYPIRQHVRFDVQETFQIACDKGEVKLDGRTIDYSNGGMSIKCVSGALAVGGEFLLTVETLGIIGKKVKAVWVRPVKDGCNAVGLKW